MAWFYAAEWPTFAPPLTIQTGTYARRHQVWDFNTPLPEPLRPITYARLLRQHGYRTGYFGKYGIGDNSKATKEVLADFDEYRSFDEYYTADDTARQWHHNRRISDLAQRFLRHSPAEHPFCLTLGFKAPHAKDDGDPVMGPYVSEPDMLQLYEHDIFRRGTTMNEQAFATLPPYIQKSEARHRWEQRFSNDALWQDSVHKYFGLVSGMDRAIGQILDMLEASGQLDNTMIVFSSDNGYMLGDYGLEGKWFGYEASIRVPLLISPPGGTRGQDVAAPVLNVDLAPTMLHMAGMAVPSRMQGKDLSPLFGGKPPADWRKDFLYEHYLPKLYSYSAGMESFLPSSEGVRGERYTYLRYPRQPGANEMLFDRQNDPDELRNLAKTADPALMTAMRRRTDELIAKGS
ncbi:sulfatase-like hydrolase/transferase [Sphingobium sp. CAP-1]|uniref:sulfatase-like hydrolase/transferase n=1 Tax=Sphingobium sp. CAP-1 TaxID=2676077 RepID=UPI0012BB465F|nr:sulfatase-like hydrolase/transferase [Sphingobium sp. CAP-1]QGP79432.1 sulfatase-like hydrolase/transferase [Sphingobium sp. CAP-1]